LLLLLFAIGITQGAHFLPCNVTAGFYQLRVWQRQIYDVAYNSKNDEHFVIYMELHSNIQFDDTVNSVMGMRLDSVGNVIEKLYLVPNIKFPENKRHPRIVYNALRNTYWAVFELVTPTTFNLYGFTMNAERKVISGPYELTESRGSRETEVSLAVDPKRNKVVMCHEIIQPQTGESIGVVATLWNADTHNIISNYLLPKGKGESYVAFSAQLGFMVLYQESANNGTFLGVFLSSDFLYTVSTIEVAVSSKGVHNPRVYFDENGQFLLTYQDDDSIAFVAQVDGMSGTVLASERLGFTNSSFSSAVWSPDLNKWLVGYEVERVGGSQILVQAVSFVPTFSVSSVFHVIDSNRTGLDAYVLSDHLIVYGDGSLRMATFDSDCSPSEPMENPGKRAGAIAGAVILSVAFAAIVASGVGYCIYRRRARRYKLQEDVGTPVTE